MSKINSFEKLKELLATSKAGDREWFLSLLDEEKQKEYEDAHLEAVLTMLRLVRIRPQKQAIKEAQAEIKDLEKEGSNAENYRKIRNLLAEIAVKNDASELKPYFLKLRKIMIDAAFNFLGQYLVYLFFFRLRQT